MIQARKSILAFALVILSATVAFPSPDFPFALDFIGDGALVGGGLAVYGTGLYLQSIKPSPNPAELNPATIPFFDRAYPATPSTTLDAIGDDVSIGLAALPFILLPGRSGAEILDLGIMYGESLGLAYSLEFLLKSAIVRYRPYAYSTTTPADFSNANIASSFPSANTSLAFSAAVFSGYVFDTLYPDSNLRYLVWASGLGIATGVSSLLVAGGDHFLSDVLAGAAIGAASGFLVPILHKTFYNAAGRGGKASSNLEIEPVFGGIFAKLVLVP